MSHANTKTTAYNNEAKAQRKRTKSKKVEQKFAKLKRASYNTHARTSHALNETLIYLMLSDTNQTKNTTFTPM